jgi:hypothetical protein
MNNETRKKALSLVYLVREEIKYIDYVKQSMDATRELEQILLQNEQENYNRTAIVYKMNGLYNLLRYDGEVLYTGNKQSCEFEKHKWDIRYECGWPDSEKGEG